MNKKDVLGARPAAWIIWKMESIPHWEKPLLCKRRDLLYCFEVPVFGCIWGKFLGGEFSYFSSMFIVLIFAGDWICKLIAFSLCSISKWYQMLHRQHFVKYFYFTPIMLFSISCIQFTNKPQHLVSIPIVQYRTIHNIWYLTIHSNHNI